MTLATRTLLLALLPAVLLVGCTSDDDRDTIDMGTTFTKEGTLAFVRPDESVIRTIDIEIAETNEERTRGLMQRRSMGYDRGMLFIFDGAEERTFIMENTPMSLDMIFVGADSQIVNIARRTEPLSGARYTSTAPAQFVVEVRAGFAERFGITDSTRIRWERDG